MGNKSPNHRQYVRNWKQRNPEKVREMQRVADRRKILKGYGLTLESYEQMLEAQDGRCAICGKSQVDNGRLLAVDHDHATGANRGLLCQECNMGLGKLGDSIDVLERALAYLRQYEPADEAVA